MQINLVHVATLLEVIYCSTFHSRLGYILQEFISLFYRAGYLRHWRYKSRSQTKSELLRPRNLRVELEVRNSCRDTRTFVFSNMELKFKFIFKYYLYGCDKMLLC